MVEVAMLQALMGELRQRGRELRRDERGEFVAQLIMIGGLAALAIAVLGIIVVKVKAKANSIPTGDTGTP